MVRADIRLFGMLSRRSVCCPATDAMFPGGGAASGCRSTWVTLDAQQLLGLPPGPQAVSLADGCRRRFWLTVITPRTVTGDQFFCSLRP